MDRYDLEARIHARYEDDGAFRVFEERIDQLEARIDRFNDKTARANATLQTTEFDERMSATESRLDRLEGRTATAKADLDTQDLDQKTQAAEGRLDRLDGRRTTTHADVDTSAFDRGIDALEQRLASNDGRTMRATATLETTEFVRGADLIDARREMIENREWIARARLDATDVERNARIIENQLNEITRPRTINLGIDQAVAARLPTIFGDVVHQLRQFQTIGAIISAVTLPGILAAAAAAVGGVTALGAGILGMVGSLGQAAAGFGTLYTAIYAGVAGLQIYNATLRNALANAQNGTFANTRFAETAQQVSDVMAGLRTRFEEVSIEMQGRTLPTLLAFGETANRYFPMVATHAIELVERLNGVSEEFNDMLNAGTTMDAVNRVLMGMVTSATHLGTIVANLAIALVHVFAAALPHGNSLLASIEQMVVKFREWTQTAEGQRGLADFFASAESAARSLAQGIANIAVGLGNIGSALNESGLTTFFTQGLLTATERFRNLAAEGTASRDAIVAFGERVQPIMAAAGEAALRVATNFFRVADEITKITGPSGAPLLADIFTAIGDASDSIGRLLVENFRILGPVLPDLIRNIAGLAEAFAGATPVLAGFLSILNFALGWFNELDVSTRRAIGAGIAFILMMRQMSGGLGSLVGAFDGPNSRLVNFARNLLGLGSNFGRAGKDKDDFRKNLGGLDADSDRSSNRLGSLGNAANVMGTRFRGAGPPVATLGRNIDGAGRSAQTAGRNLDGFVRGADLLGARARTANSALTPFSRGLQTTGRNAQTAGRQIGAVGTQANTLGTRLRTAVAGLNPFQRGLQQTGRNAQNAGRQIGGVGTQANRLGTRMRTAVAGLNPFQRGLQQTGRNAQQAGRQIGTLGNAANVLGTRFRTANAGLTPFQRGLQTTGRNAQTAGRDLNNVGNAANTTGGRFRTALAALNPFSTGLRTVSTNARNSQRDLDGAGSSADNAGRRFQTSNGMLVPFGDGLDRVRTNASNASRDLDRAGGSADSAGSRAGSATRVGINPLEIGLAAVGVAAIAAYQNSDKFREAVDKAAVPAGKLAGQVGDALAPAIQDLATDLENSAKRADTMSISTSRTGEEMGTSAGEAETFYDKLQTLADGLNTANDYSQDMARNLRGEFKEALFEAENGAETFRSKVLNGFRELAQDGILGTLIPAAESAVNEFNRLRDEGGGAAESLRGAVIAAFSSMASEAGSILNSMADTAISAFNRAYNAIVGSSIVPDLARDVNLVLRGMNESMESEHAPRLERALTTPFQRAAEQAAQHAQRLQAAGAQGLQQGQGQAVGEGQGPAQGQQFNPIRGMAQDATKEVDTMSRNLNAAGQSLSNQFTSHMGDLRRRGVGELQELNTLGSTAVSNMARTSLDQTSLLSRDSQAQFGVMNREIPRLAEDQSKSVIQQTQLMNREATRQVNDLRTQTVRTFQAQQRDVTREATLQQTNVTRQAVTMRTNGVREATTLQTTATTQARTMQTNVTREATTMQTNGTREATTLRTNGVRELTSLQTEGTRQAQTTQTNVTRELTTMNTSGSQQIEQLRTSGTQSMQAAEPEWKTPVRNASSGIQAYLNDMLYGMAQVIQQASLPIAAPSEFNIRLTGNAQGGLYAHADGGLMAFHGGSATPNEADMSSLLALMKAGQVAMDDGAGGISRSFEQSQLHWWGEGNADEAFIPADGPPERMLPILKEAASWYNAQIVPEEGTPNVSGRPGMPSANDQWGPRGMGYVSGMGEDWSQPHWDVEPYIRERAEAIAEATGTIWNTYVGHGTQGGSWETVTVDFWGPPGQGSQSMTYEQGMAVADMVLSQYASDLMYLIAQGSMYRGGWGEFPEDPHYDHTHVSWGGAGGEYGGAGGGWRPHIPDLIAENFPEEASFGPAVYEQAATQMGAIAREQIVRILQGSRRIGVPGAPAVGSGDTATLIAEYFPLEAQGMAETVMQRESGGDPSAYNPSGASGLFQIMPSTAEGYGYDPSQLFDPNYNAMVAGEIYRQEGWGPWSQTAYTNGGIAVGPQQAMVGENGPEMFIPLHDPQATTRFMDFLESAVETRHRAQPNLLTSSGRAQYGQRLRVDDDLGFDDDDDDDDDDRRGGRRRRRRRHRGGPQGRRPDEREDRGQRDNERQQRDQARHLQSIEDHVRATRNHNRNIEGHARDTENFVRRSEADGRRIRDHADDTRVATQRMDRQHMPRQTAEQTRTADSMRTNTTETQAMRRSTDYAAQQQGLNTQSSLRNERNTGTMVQPTQDTSRASQQMVQPTTTTAQNTNSMVPPTSQTAQNTSQIAPSTAQSAQNTGAMVQPTQQTAQSCTNMVQPTATTAQNTSAMTPAVQQTAQACQTAAGQATAIAGSAVAIAGSSSQTAANTGQMVNTLSNIQRTANTSNTQGGSISQNTGQTQGGGNINMRVTTPGQRSSSSSGSGNRQINSQLNRIATNTGNTANRLNNTNTALGRNTAATQQGVGVQRQTNSGVAVLSRQQAQGNSYANTSLQVQRSGNRTLTNVQRTGGQTAQNTQRGSQASQQMVQPTRDAANTMRSQSQPISQTAQHTAQQTAPTQRTATSNQQMVSPTAQTSQNTGTMVQPTQQTAQSCTNMVSPTASTAQNTGTMVQPTQQTAQSCTSMVQPTTQTATNTAATTQQCQAIAGSATAIAGSTAGTEQNTAEMVGALDSLGNAISSLDSGGGSGGGGGGGGGQTSTYSNRNVQVQSYRNVQNTGRTQGRGARINVPEYATGGLITTPHIGMLGEAGPEAILPLTDRHIMRQFLSIVRDIGNDGQDIHETDARIRSQRSREVLGSASDAERRRGSDGRLETSQADPDLKRLLGAMIEQNQQLIDLLGSTGIKLDPETKDDMYERNRRAVPNGLKTTRGRTALKSVRETDAMVSNMTGRTS